MTTVVYSVQIVDESGNPIGGAIETGGHLEAIDAKTPFLGQAIESNSVPVVLTVGQIAALSSNLFDSTGTFRLPDFFSSLPVVIDRSSSTHVTYTVQCGGITYIYTITLNTSGETTGYSGWVIQ